ncbi:AbrB/MazE/SpoVT family DNA-binding domain-containing protein [Marmoricola sp. OAE513]|uniref:AbrB/MazE/SpoVT family DNA-binding domain-containing protein n=1 Tax=Marmoricola sp. OAE513 TaxID=2817894 RepID=UPI001E1263E2
MSKRGRVRIPADVRAELQAGPGTRLRFVRVEPGRFRLEVEPPAAQPDDAPAEPS